LFNQHSGAVAVQYVARQLGNSPRIVFKHYARWIESADGGRERAKMDAFLDLAWKKQTAS
jgi:hypothetical protein